jgi:RimJ/RimL family protein N-acetyltransferase
MRAKLGDDLLLLHPLRVEDAATHLAGEDAEQIRWLSGTPATLEGVRDWIERTQAATAAGESLWHYGLWLRASRVLVGNIEARADASTPGIGPGEANLAYVIFPAWRRRGIASRAVEIMCAALAADGFERAVIRTDLGNEASIGVARKAGFQPTGVIDANGEQQFRFVRELHGPNAS